MSKSRVSLQGTVFSVWVCMPNGSKTSFFRSTLHSNLHYNLHSTYSFCKEILLETWFAASIVFAWQMVPKKSVFRSALNLYFTIYILHTHCNIGRVSLILPFLTQICPNHAKIAVQIFALLEFSFQFPRNGSKVFLKKVVSYPNLFWLAIRIMWHKCNILLKTARKFECS